MKIAADVGKQINKIAPTLPDEGMPYKAQYILEEVIRILQEAV